MFAMIPDVMWMKMILPMALEAFVWAYLVAISIGYVSTVYISVKDGGENIVWAALEQLGVAPTLPGAVLLMGAIWTICWLWRGCYGGLEWIGQKYRPIQVPCTLIDGLRKLLASLASITVTLIALPVVLPLALLIGLLAWADSGEREIHDV